MHDIANRAEANLHLFRTKPSAKQGIEAFVTGLLRVVAYLSLAFAATIILIIVVRGAPTVFKASPPFVNWEFLTQYPETLHVFDLDGKHYELGDAAYRKLLAEKGNPEITEQSYVYAAGGIWPCILGTVQLVLGAIVIALVLGVASAIYLSEYSRDTPFIRAIRLAILNLAGVPSIVFGLFGVGLFVSYLGWNISLRAGWFTLAFMILPVIITASEESLRAVPRGFREGSLALGATHWQTIRTAVLPYALPGILTSSILGVARVAGETAPIMFTAAYVIQDKATGGEASGGPFAFITQGVMALPYHIYVISSKIPQNEHTARVQYGTAFVFLVIVLLIGSVAIVLRERLRGRYKN